MNGFIACATSSTALTMFVYAAQRQRLPLMRSAISARSSTVAAVRSSVTALGAPWAASSRTPTAEHTWPGVQKPHW